MDHDFDYLVIGSGFGGSVSALRLAERGYSVGVLEAGKRWASSDFPKTNWSAHRFLWAPLLRCFGIMRLTIFKDVFVLSGAGVGGGSLVYANTLLVPPERFFTDGRWAHLAPWKEVLEPHYQTALRMLGAVVVEHEGRSDELLREVMEEMGRGHTYHKPTVGVYFGEGPGEDHPDPYFEGEGPERTGCNFCGGCMVGCRHGSKNTLDKNYLWLAERLGTQIFAETMVTDVRPIESGREGGGYEVTTFRSTSPVLKLGKRTFTADNVVFSAGAMGTTKLLLDCKERGSLPALSPQLGNYVRTNSEAILGVEAGDPEADFSHGIAISSGAHPDEDTHIETVRYSAGSDLLAMLATAMTDGGSTPRRMAQWLKVTLRTPWRSLKSALPFGWARRSVILLVMQPVSNYMRFVTRRRLLAPWTTKLATENDSGQKVPATIPIGNAVARRMADKLDGLPRGAFTEVLMNVPTTAHILGGCAMGDSAETGVIDERNRVWGYEGLYVVDGSMIPANLGVNPSLTITAMAEHAMSHVAPKVGGDGGAA